MKEDNTFPADDKKLGARAGGAEIPRAEYGRRRVGTGRIDALNAKSISTVESREMKGGGGIGKWKALSYFRRGI